jgi:uncharacterized protein
MKKKETVLIKPASSLCNLDCDYCFYKDEAAHRSKACSPVMNEETIRSILSRFLPAAETLSVCFQGGEPMMAGLDWFKRFVSIATQMNKNGRTAIEYSIQTNGTLIDQSWCDFLRDNAFLVGVSFDGFPMLHNIHRGHTGSKVLGAIRLLERSKVEFNIVCVVTNEMVDNAPGVWDYLMEKGLIYLQFIPCMNPIQSSGKDYLDAKAYGHFLSFLFEKWHDALYSGRPVYIRLFESFMQVFMERRAEQCDVNGTCSAQYVIESDGSIYPCDFYCTDSYLLGNINTEDIDQIDQRRKELKFIESSVTSNPECADCDVNVLCNGGCRRNRTPDGKFRFCDSYKMFAMNESKRLEEIIRFYISALKKS